jgi:hypothetical protein
MLEQLCANSTEIYAKGAFVQNRYNVSKNRLEATETEGVAPRHGLEPRVNEVLRHQKLADSTIS